MNGSDATVFAFSMADGIVSWLGGTGGSIDNIILNINRCRNYSTNLISFQNSNSSNGGYGRTGGISEPERIIRMQRLQLVTHQ